MKTINAPAKPAPKTGREKALDAFIRNTNRARELAAKIGAHLEDHLGVAPEDVTWADAGSAGHVIEELEDIARFLDLIGEEK